MARTVSLLLILVLNVSSPAWAQRRGEQNTTVAELTVELPASRFGDIQVPAHRYRVQISGDTLVLANPDTMEVQATLMPAVAELSSGSASRAEVQVKGNDLVLTVWLGEHSYTVKGQKAAAQVPQTGEAEAPKQEREVNSAADGEPKTPAAQVAQAVQRYLPGLATCIDAAQKAHWITDDPRFSNCVCPVALKWQMPHLSAPLRMHQKLVKGKFGMSFTVAPDGRVSQCRVWAGPKSPETAPAAAQGKP